ncbi:hypothetical protein BSL78_16536 [Apostichopus japonicus]|uniref:Uncharacterized protein n=1 Tax=Stichopus japonicus TaxID=307972 RepID=A0A2G8KF32_STIJA|nr:hypothetical protein BSL78_16536 [Apostichopus japonicus]
MAEAGATNLPTGGDGIARRIEYLKKECEKLLPDIRERLTETGVRVSDSHESSYLNFPLPPGIPKEDRNLRGTQPPRGFHSNEDEGFRRDPLYVYRDRESHSGSEPMLGNNSEMTGHHRDNKRTDTMLAGSAENGRQFLEDIYDVESQPVFSTQRLHQTTPRYRRSSKENSNVVDTHSMPGSGHRDRDRPALSHMLPERTTSNEAQQPCLQRPYVRYGSQGGETGKNFPFESTPKFHEYQWGVDSTGQAQHQPDVSQPANPGRFRCENQEEDTRRSENQPSLDRGQRRKIPQVLNVQGRNEFFETLMDIPHTPGHSIVHRNH